MNSDERKSTDNGAAASDAQAWQAFLYASGAMSPREAKAFEQQILAELESGQTETCDQLGETVDLFALIAAAEEVPAARVSPASQVVPVPLDVNASPGHDPRRRRYQTWWATAALAAAACVVALVAGRLSTQSGNVDVAHSSAVGAGVKTTSGATEHSDTASLAILWSQTVQSMSDQDEEPSEEDLDADPELASIGRDAIDSDALLVDDDELLLDDEDTTLANLAPEWMLAGANSLWGPRTTSQSPATDDMPEVPDFLEEN
jgi:hypothetical protein